MADLVIRPLEAADEAAWHPLFAGYRRFYEQPEDEAMQRVVWDWLMDPAHALAGMVAAEEDGTLLGLAHWHVWPSTLGATHVGYLSDLFVDPAARGRQVGKQLYEAMLDVCRREGWPALTLLTQEGNTVGRSLYDQYASVTDFRLYSGPVGDSSASDA